jgi:hypothetical protein
MSANTLTNLLPTIYSAAEQVSREMVGFIPAVYLNPAAEEVAKDQTITYPIVGTMAAADATPSATLPDPSGVTVGAGTMSISKVRKVSFPWNGEEVQSVAPIFGSIKQNQFLQAMRTLVNEMEADLAALYTKASRAYGTAGTTPFDTTNKLAFSAQMGKILTDNGCPISDRQMVIDTAAGAALRTLTQLTNVNESGNDTLLRQGVLLPIHGFDVRESGQVKLHPATTASGYLVDLTAGYAAGTVTVLHVDTGANNVVAGDVITNTKTGRDTNKYIINTGFVGSGDQDLILAKPGNLVAWVNNDPVSIAGSYRANLAFHRNAIHLLTRLPKMPPGGDAALAQEVITDPVSGISFQVLEYGEYRQKVFEVAIAWGVKAVKTEWIATLLG